MDSQEIEQLVQRAKKRNITNAGTDSDSFAEFNSKRRGQRTGEKIGHSDGAVREIGMIPLSVYNILPEDIKNDNDKLLHWLETDEFGKYFKTVGKI